VSKLADHIVALKHILYTYMQCCKKVSVSVLNVSLSFLVSDRKLKVCLTLVSRNFVRSWSWDHLGPHICILKTC